MPSVVIGKNLAHGMAWWGDSQSVSRLRDASGNNLGKASRFGKCLGARKMIQGLFISSGNELKMAWGMS